MFLYEVKQRIRRAKRLEMKTQAIRGTSLTDLVEWMHAWEVVSLPLHMQTMAG